MDEIRMLTLSKNRNYVKQNIAFGGENCMVIKMGWKKIIGKM